MASLLFDLLYLCSIFFPPIYEIFDSKWLNFQIGPLREISASIFCRL